MFSSAKIKKFGLNMLILGGYLFSIPGGIPGLLIGAILARFRQEGVIKHAKIIIGASIASVLLYLIFVLEKLRFIDVAVMSFIIIASFAVSAIIGGYIAQRKGDFITRGFFLCLLTGVWGLVILVFAPDSKARNGKQGNSRYWPRESWISLLLLSCNIAAFIITGKLVA